MDTFKKNRFTLWRDHLLAIGLLLVGLRILSASFHEHGHEIICLVLQISAGAVLLAAIGLSIFWLSEPSLQIDKLGISENGFLLKSLNWSMTWNDIAYAQINGDLRSRVVLIGLHSEQPEHVVSGYERFETILERIRTGLKRFGRKVYEESQAPVLKQS